MIIDIRNDADIVTVTVAGKIDTDSAAKFEEAVDSVDRNKKLILDFAGVPYITSSGLRLLLMLCKRYKGGRMEILNVCQDVKRTFEFTGFDSLIPFQPVHEDESAWLKLSLSGFLQKKVQENPDYPIMTYGDEVYTWKDIDVLSQIVAMDLSALGIRKGTHVGIMGMNSANWVITFFAVQKLGAIAMLLNFNLTPEELQVLSGCGDITHLCYGDIPYMEDEAAFLASITDDTKSKIRHTYSISNGRNFRDRMGEYEALRELFEDVAVPDDPALIIFTSGSTGLPKAVIHSAYSLLNAAFLFADNYHLNSEDCCCQVLPLFHIFGLICSLLGNLLRDSKIAIPENMRTMTVLETLSVNKCTQLYSVPTFLIALARSRYFTQDTGKSIRCIMMGGAPVTASQLTDIQNSFPRAYLAVGYGLSEIAPVSLTAYKDSDEHVENTIGKPIGDIQVNVADPETGAILSKGCEGELLVRGFNTMAGYYHLPLQDQPLDEEGWLHTGDLAMISDDGYISLTGRIKDIIIRGGENIVPKEIETVLTQFPDIADAKVIGIPDQFYGEIVGAAIVTKSGKDIDPESLRMFLQGKLSLFKIPAHFFRYDEFPMLSNGKIDEVNLKKDVIARAG